RKRWPVVAKRPTRTRYVSAIIERHDNQILIALPVSDDKQKGENAERLWQFPRDAARADESAEAAMRRIAQEQLGVMIEIVVGQPPIVARTDNDEIELRYFFCGIITGEPRSKLYSEFRWVLK